MNLTIKSGQRKLTIHKPERAALEKARDLCGELATLSMGHVSEAAGEASKGLAKILAEFPAEANGQASDVQKRCDEAGVPY